MIKVVYSQYISDIEKDIARDLKSFWRYMQQKNTCAVPACMSFDGRVVDTALDIVPSFGAYFASVYDPVSSGTEHSDIKIVNNNLMVTLHQFTEADLVNVAKKLKRKMSSGPDGMPNFF